MIVVFAVSFLLLNNFRLGRRIYVIGSNEEAAIISGVNVNRTKLILFGLSGHPKDRPNGRLV